jgi:hypothetical protein
MHDAGRLVFGAVAGVAARLSKADQRCAAARRRLDRADDRAICIETAAAAQKRSMCLAVPTMYDSAKVQRPVCCISIA